MLPRITHLDFAASYRRVRTLDHSTHNVGDLNTIMARTGSFPVAVAIDLIRRYGVVGQRVLDPFCGKGTALLAARSLGCSAFGLDVAPEAVICSAAKQTHVNLFGVLEYVHKLKLNKPGLNSGGIPSSLQHFFHPETLTQIVRLQSVLRVDLNSDSQTRREHALVVLAALLGILHGHASYSLSIPSAHAYCMAPEYVKKYARTNGLEAPARDVRSCLIAKLSRTLANCALPPVTHRILRATAQTMTLHMRELVGKIDLIVTSPPYLDAQTYAKDNWMRHWLLGYDRAMIGKEYLQTGSVLRYKREMAAAIAQMARMLRSGGTLVCVAGDVRKRRNGGIPTTVDTAAHLCELLVQSGQFTVQGLEAQAVSSSKRYYHALVNSNGHTRVPLIEKTIVAYKV